MEPHKADTKKVIFSWSSGKDAAVALHLLLQDPSVEIGTLLTTVNGHHDRVSMHGLPSKLLRKQAKSIGLPIQEVTLPKDPSMEEYGEIMSKTLNDLKKENYTHCGFGDIFLEDLKNYRDQQLDLVRLKGLYPIWLKESSSLIHHFIESGFKAILICIDASKLDESFLGREIDAQFLQDLPDGVDPCGENGEFHTFCYDGPIFSQPVQFQKGQKIYREYPNPDGTPTGKGFWFLDLIPM